MFQKKYGLILHPPSLTFRLQVLPHVLRARGRHADTVRHPVVLLGRKLREFVLYSDDAAILFVHEHHVLGEQHSAHLWYQALR